MPHFKCPKIIAHRGASGYAPENTLESFVTAADMGIDWIEFDVRLSKDGIPMVFHDADLDRTTNASGPFVSLTKNELQDLDAGHWYGESFTGLTIPTLEDVLEICATRDLGFNIELKPNPNEDIETTEAALDLIARYWDDHHRLIISSFSGACLERAAEMAPEWTRGLLLAEQFETQWQELADHVDAKLIHINADNCERELVEDMIDHGYGILAYTVNDPDQCRRLQGWGLDGFFTDVPDVIRDSILTVH